MIGNNIAEIIINLLSEEIREEKEVQENFRIILSIWFASDYDAFNQDKHWNSW